MPAFLRINPELRINLDNVTVVRAPAPDEKYAVFDDKQPGPIRVRNLPIPVTATVIEFVGKKAVVVLDGGEAERFRNFCDGVGHALSGSGETGEETSDVTSALRGERDFSDLTHG